VSGAFRTGELAEAAGVNRQTLRYYERRGLLAQPQRSPGGHRLYPPESLTTLRVIKTAQRLGFTLDEVAGLLDLSPHCRGDRAQPGLKARAAAKLAEVESRIEDLRATASTLRTAIEAGCDDLLACAASEACPVSVAGPRQGISREAP
jgi:MerR family mercuric resistance operon transcriptional regulator